MKEPVWIPDEIRTVVERVDKNIYRRLQQNVFYQFGSGLEILAKLQELSNSIYDKDRKYPLIALFTDIVQNVGDPIGMFGTVAINVLIATQTKQTYKAEERLAFNFKPLLYPIYDRFIYEVQKHKQFSFVGAPIHDRIDRLFLGRDGFYGKEGNVFNDYLDAIEIRNLRITVKNKICVSLTNNFYQ
jgi:hypothetical protein